MSLTNEHIKQRLVEKFPEITGFSEPYGMLTFEAPKELNLKVLNFLYDDEELKFRFMTDLCGVHYPDNKGKEIARQVESGMVGVNQGIGGVSGTPWVGIKQSGFGYLGSIDGLRQFTVPKKISYKN